MKKKRPRRKPAKPPPERSARSARGARRVGSGRQPVAPPAAALQLQYKVVELSAVDEGTLERTLNEYVPRGWTLDGIQFAMRESSRRPAMAFVLFTREVEAREESFPEAEVAAPVARLEQLAEAALAEDYNPPPPGRALSAHERLVQMAEAGDEEAAASPLVEGGRMLELDLGDEEPLE